MADVTPPSRNLLPGSPSEGGSGDIAADWQERYEEGELCEEDDDENTDYADGAECTRDWLSEPPPSPARWDGAPQPRRRARSAGYEERVQSAADCKVRTCRLVAAEGAARRELAQAQALLRSRVRVSQQMVVLRCAEAEERAVRVAAEGGVRKGVYVAAIDEEVTARRARRQRAAAELLAALLAGERAGRADTAGSEEAEREGLLEARAANGGRLRADREFRAGIRVPVPPQSDWGDACCPFRYRSDCPIAAKPFVSRHHLCTTHFRAEAPPARAPNSLTASDQREGVAFTRLDRMLAKFRRSGPLCVEQHEFMFPAQPGTEPVEFDVSAEACSQYSVRHCERLRCGPRCASSHLRGKAVTVVGVRRGQLWVRVDGVAAAEVLAPSTRPSEVSCWEQMEVTMDCRRLCETGRLRNHAPAVTAKCYVLEPQTRMRQRRRLVMSSGELAPKRAAERAADLFPHQRGDPIALLQSDVNAAVRQMWEGEGEGEGARQRSDEHESEAESSGLPERALAELTIMTDADLARQHTAMTWSSGVPRDASSDAAILS